MPRRCGESAGDWHSRAQLEYSAAQDLLAAHLARLDPAERTDLSPSGRFDHPLCRAADERAAAAFAEWYEAAAAVVAEGNGPWQARTQP